jgi:hypothetical protein
MSPVKPQILAAISAAIQSYLADEEAARQQQQVLSLGLAGLIGAGGPPVNFWSLSGRQSAMQQRFLMQRRSFR